MESPVIIELAVYYILSPLVHAHNNYSHLLYMQNVIIIIIILLLLMMLGQQNL